jgi:hypothetical protein
MTVEEFRDFLYEITSQIEEGLITDYEAWQRTLEAASRVQPPADTKI